MIRFHRAEFIMKLRITVYIMLSGKEMEISTHEQVHKETK